MSLVLRNEPRKITPKKLILDRKCFKERHENCKDARTSIIYFSKANNKAKNKNFVNEGFMNH
jgi:hypothetical protein